MGRMITVALAGNPNCGKTTLFNALTGSHQHVGNYPGVTVEKKTGVCTRGDLKLEITDLPGTYALTAWSLDEKVARDFLVETRPDVVVNVLDMSNIERHLYLTTQLIELGMPLVLAFNMADVAEGQGLSFDLQRLSRHFGAPIVPLVAHKGKGLEELLTAVEVVAFGPGAAAEMRLDYGEEIQKELDRLAPLLEKEPSLPPTLQAVARRPGRTPAWALGWSRWVALKLLEEDCDVTGALQRTPLEDAARQSVAGITSRCGDRPAVRIADARYGYISGACTECVTHTAEVRHNWSDRMDTVLTHPVLGLPIFLAVMYAVFGLTFRLGEYPMGWLESAFGWVADMISHAWPASWPSWLESLLTDGVIGGVGGVLVFLPSIVLLFLGISLLEYTGYMARAAFVMDRYMHRIGLHGKSFVPMLIGFGCTVPAILATRTLDSRRDRLVTMLVLPLMSCGARLPIYALLIPTFFAPAVQGVMLWAIYVVGILLAIAGAKALGVFVFKEKSEGLVIELPPYRLPTVRSVMMDMWFRSWLYLRKAGTIILGVSVAMWILAAYPEKKDLADGLTPEQIQAERLEYSMAGRLGQFMEPALAPMGFDWKIGTAMIGAMAAKEVFVAQLGIIHAMGNGEQHVEGLRESLRRHYSPLKGLCMMLFMLIGFPCAATVAATRSESGEWKWALAQLGGLTLLAYVLATAVYQLGRLMGL